MSSIPLHPERGVDPHLTFCPTCGGDTNELTLGVIIEMTFPDGVMAYANRGKTADTARQLGYSPRSYTSREVESHERLPATQPCDTCKEVFTEGGIVFRCECGKTGLIKGYTEVAKIVRKQMGIDPPKVCGLQMCPKDCMIAGCENAKKDSARQCTQDSAQPRLKARKASASNSGSGRKRRTTRKRGRLARRRGK